MTPDDFKAWRKTMGLSQVAAAKALDLSHTTIELYEAGRRRDNGKPVEIPLTVRLAMSALSAGLGPWAAP